MLSQHAPVGTLAITMVPVLVSWFQTVLDKQSKLLLQCCHVRARCCLWQHAVCSSQLAVISAYVSACSHVCTTCKQCICNSAVLVQEGPLMKLMQPLLFLVGANDSGFDPGELRELSARLPSPDVRCAVIPVRSQVKTKHFEPGWATWCIDACVVVHACHARARAHGGDRLRSA